MGTTWKTIRPGGVAAGGASSKAVAKGCTATVHARGVLQESAAQFWNTREAPGQQPFSYEAGVGGVIAGWDQGAMGMTIGEQASVRAPSVPSTTVVVFLSGSLGAFCGWFRARARQRELVIPAVEGYGAGQNGPNSTRTPTPRRAAASATVPPLCPYPLASGLPPQIRRAERTFREAASVDDINLYWRERHRSHQPRFPRRTLVSSIRHMLHSPCAALLALSRVTRGACAWGCSAPAAGFSSWGIPPNAALEFTIEVLRIESGRSTALSGKVGGLMGGHAGGDDGGGAGGDGGAPRTAASAAAFSSAATAHLSASGGAPTAAAGATRGSGAAATAETGAVAQSGGTPAPSAPSTRNVWLELD